MTEQQFKQEVKPKVDALLLAMKKHHVNGLVVFVKPDGPTGARLTITTHETKVGYCFDVIRQLRSELIKTASRAAKQCQGRFERKMQRKSQQQAEQESLAE